MNDDLTIVPFLLDDEDENSFCMLVSESEPYTDLNTLLKDLHTAKGSGFIWTLKEIASHYEFKPLPSESNIFVVGGETAEDYDNLLNAARKAVEHGYRVFVLPNPKGIRTADFIFERKGVYKMFDLKTIVGKSSVSNRLLESIGQTNRVLLNMAGNYNTRSLACEIKHYFEINENAIEVLVFKGRKRIAISRFLVKNPSYFRIFKNKYER